MWLLFQIKRFFLIFGKESFLFVRENIICNLRKRKQSGRKLVVFQKKGLPNFKKEIDIKLDRKYYDFYTLQPKNEKPFYLNSPLFILLRGNRESILQNLLRIFDLSYDFKLKIGIELEFYIRGGDLNIKKELKKLLPNVLDVEKEKGEGQFEIKTLPYVDIATLVRDYIGILEVLKKFSADNGLDISFDAMPFKNDCGSALQINLSLVDVDGNNLFARTRINGGFSESPLMLNCVAGLLKNVNNNILLYIDGEKSMERFDVEKNRKIRDGNKYPAPTFVSWGINNRSASIRIPTPPQIDLDSYLEEDKKSRRIEYRVPSANADIYLVLIGVVSAIIEGIDNGLLPHVEKTSFDVLDNNENLEKIANDFFEANDCFRINEDVLYF